MIVFSVNIAQLFSARQYNCDWKYVSEQCAQFCKGASMQCQRMTVLTVK